MVSNYAPEVESSTGCNVCLMSRSMAASQRQPEFQIFEPHARRRLDGISEIQAKRTRVARHFFPVTLL